MCCLLLLGACLIASLIGCIDCVHLLVLRACFFVLRVCMFVCACLRVCVMSCLRVSCDWVVCVCLLARLLGGWFSVCGIMVFVCGFVVGVCLFVGLVMCSFVCVLRLCVWRFVGLLVSMRVLVCLCALCCLLALCFLLFVYLLGCVCVMMRVIAYFVLLLVCCLFARLRVACWCVRVCGCVRCL